MDLWGQALVDYHSGSRDTPLYLETSFGHREQVPLEEFFKYELQFSSLEHFALDLCQGRILDLGAGAGPHSLFLQAHDFSVTSLEISRGACQVMRARGLQQVVESDWRNFHTDIFDTVLLMMNGAGLAGTLAKLGGFFADLKQLMAPSGQIIIDSCDVQYLYRKESDYPAGYYGNLEYCYHYQGQSGQAFPWLFVDPFNLLDVAQAQGLEAQIVYQQGYEYLARLRLT